MTIRFACDRDIPGMIDLLQQVGEVHHRIRPDLFRAGAQKYDEAALNALLTDPNRPILAAEIEGKLVGYAFCILQVTENDPVLCDRKVLYIDDLFKAGKGSPDTTGPTKAEINLAYDIISCRYNSCLTTIVSTEIYSQALVKIDEAVGSRLVEMAGEHVYNIKHAPGRNYRLRKTKRAMRNEYDRWLNKSQSEDSDENEIC